MENIKKIIRLLRDNELINSYHNEYMQKQINEQEKIERIFSNFDYLNWIIEFTNKISSFSSWTLLHKDKLNEVDIENIENLILFYKGIEYYANKNYLYPFIDSNNTYYQIKFNNLGFKIGVTYGQGLIPFCEKTAIINENEFIDFNSIIQNKEQDNVKEINQILKELEDLIITTYKKGVPIEAIKNTTDQVINEIIWKKKDKKKILVK